MPLLASNFTSNSLQGTVFVENGFANVNLQVEPFALEGNKSFVIKLRKDSFSGTVLSTSAPITITDNSTIATVTANISSVAEGNLVQFTVTTTNVINNANLFFSVLPRSANITFADFTANIGMVTIVNNTGTFTLRANADLSRMDETGETFAVQMRTNSPVGNIVFSNLSNVTILDVSQSFNILSFVENSSTVGEGTPITLTFNATNIPTGTVFHYFTEGNATTSTFTGGNTGSFVMNGFSNTITLNPTGVPYGTTQNFNVKLRAHSNTGAVVATSNNLIVVDGAIAYMTATGGTVIDSEGYRIHAFTTSGNLTVSALGAGSGNFADYLVVAGGGGGGTGYFGFYGGGGGGGAGGVLTSNVIIAATGSINATVGGGGTSNSTGGNTTLSGIISANAYGGGGGVSASNSGRPGGSGGGGATSVGPSSYGLGTPGQGHRGGLSSPVSTNGNNNTDMGGGGGGAGEAGHWVSGDPTSPTTGTVAGGTGLAISWVPTSYGTSGPGAGRWFGGGGGGGDSPNGYAARQHGGAGGGGYGGGYYGTNSAHTVGLARGGADGGGNATANTGGGGGGVGAGGAASGTGLPGLGGSGIVLIRYPYVAPPTVSNVLTSSNVFTVDSNITFTVNAQNANLLTLYYSTDGNVTPSNFINGNTGSFVANASGGIVTLQANTNIPLNESRSFRLQIRQDSTSGFISGSSANIEIAGYATYVYATGGDLITVAGGYRTHVFTSSNTFNVSKITAGASNVEYLLVAGGGGGAVGLAPFVTPGSAGGAGGLLTGNVTVTGQTYTVTVGGGGTSAPARGVNGSMGSNTIVFGITTFGGGGGSYALGSKQYGLSGGSGGGAGGYVSTNGDNKYGGNAIVGQGYPGGSMTGSNPGGSSSTGGGGAGGAGADFVGVDNGPRIGGIGLAIPWAPSSYGTPGPAPGRWFAGGGGGSTDVNTGQPGAGGAGGGGRGAMASPSQDLQAFGGNAFTGGGGGGGYSPTYLAGSGGSGIVIIRYPYS